MNGPSPLVRLRSVPRRTALVAAAAVLGVAAATAVIAVTNGPPDTSRAVHYAALAGAGSDTTVDLFAALSAPIPDLGSVDARQSGPVTTKDPQANRDCTITRPAGDGDAVRALVAAQAAPRDTGAPACLDFARTSTDASGEFAGAGLTWVPFARDAVTFVQRADSPNPRSLSTAALRAVYTCADTAYRPLLPPAGSGLRVAFLAAIGLADAPGFAAAHPCVTDVDRLVDSDGQALTDPRHIAPYSVAQYLAQTGGAEPDLHGTALLGLVDGVAPAAPSGPTAVGIAMRVDTPNSRNFTAEQLRSVYTCSAAPAAQRRYVPMLPEPGSPVRAAFLALIGVPDAPDFTTVHPCVTQVPENRGTVLTDIRGLVPYSVEQYLAQVARTAPDTHGNAVLGRIGDAAPSVLNPAFPLVHDEYVVVPTAALVTAPAAAVFAGPGSALCTHGATVARFGFAAAPDCGTTTRRTAG